MNFHCCCIQCYIIQLILSLEGHLLVMTSVTSAKEDILHAALGCYLFVCLQYITKSYGQILMKPS